MGGRGKTGGFRNPGWWRRPWAIAEWLREAGPLWPIAALALAALVIWGRGAGVLLVAVILLYEVRERAWRRAQRPPAPQRIDLASLAPHMIPPGAGMGGIQAPQALTQDDYVALLERDQTRANESFVLRGLGARVVDLDEHELEWDCRRCHQRAVTLVIHHPIWDGPRENAGSGIVDDRVTPYCPRCDALTIALAWGYGLEPSPQLFAQLTSGTVTGGRMPGIPVRLPYTGVGVIRLHTALWLRAPFHNLAIQVERAVPPPPAPKDQPHAYTVTRPTLDATGKRFPCEVCGRPVDDPLHAAAPTP